MYFFNEGGKQVLDLRGDLVLTHNDALVKGRNKSAAPRSVKNAKYIKNISTMGLRSKLIATGAAISFIWGPSESLNIETEGM